MEEAYGGKPGTSQCVRVWPREEAIGREGNYLPQETF